MRHARTMERGGAACFISLALLVQAPAALASPPTEAAPAGAAPAEAAAPSESAPPPAEPLVAPAASAPSIFGRPMLRSGFHFHADLGIGSGSSIFGLYHSMELGWSFSGYSVSLLHSFLQYKGVFGPSGTGPDEIGGFFLQVKGPLYFEDLSWKFAAGVGGTVDQSNGFEAHPGFGINYGVDLHFPIWPKFGPTLSLSAMNVEDRGNFYFGGALALGVTVF